MRHNSSSPRMDSPPADEESLHLPLIPSSSLRPSTWTSESLYSFFALCALSLIDVLSTFWLEPTLSLDWDFKEESHDVTVLSLARLGFHALALTATLLRFAPLARKRHEESYSHENDSEKYESKLPQVGGAVGKDPKREWERKRHADQKRSGVQQALVLGLVFMVDTFTSVFCSIKTVEYKYDDAHHEREAVTFCAQIVLANAEFFLLKSILAALQKERGRLVPSLHNHELFYAPKMPGHWCDGCHSRIVGEAYRCKLCDFDACPSCFDKAWRATRTTNKQNGQPSDSNAAVKTAPSNFDYFVRALQQGRNHWVLFTISGIALLFSSLLSLALPSFTGQILDSVYRDDKSQFKESIRNMVIASTLISLLAVAQYSTISIASRRIAAAVRSDLFRAILTQDIAFFDAQMSGLLVSRLTNDVAGMVAPWSTIFNTILSSSLTLVGGLILCIYTSWKLSALACASIGPIVFLTSIYAKWSQRVNREIYAALGDANSTATEALQNIRTVRAFSTESNEMTKYSNAVDNALAKGTKDALASAGTSTLTGFVDLATSALILGFGGYTAMSDSADSGLTAGKLLQFQLYWQMIDSSWKSLNGVVNSLTRAAGAANRVIGLLDSLPKIDLDKGIQFSTQTPPEIEFRNVHFRYATRPESLVLQDVSFSCRSGQTVAIVGSSGSGKSTIISLMMRLYDVESGKILINGTDLRELNVRSFHDHIGLVQQDTQLFATSVLDNITYGCNHPYTADDVLAASKRANIHDEIMRFEDGYSTKIGERGIRLSGGQRQRIACARVFLRKPSLLLLDEATSALDAQNEAMVQASIDEMLGAGGSSSVIVAHRLSTVRNANVIICMDRGKVMQIGSHDELLRDTDGRYATLVKTQLIAVAGKIPE